METVSGETVWLDHDERILYFDLSTGRLVRTVTRKYTTTGQVFDRDINHHLEFFDLLPGEFQEMERILRDAWNAE